MSMLSIQRIITACCMLEILPLERLISNRTIFGASRYPIISWNCVFCFSLLLLESKLKSGIWEFYINN